MSDPSQEKIYTGQISYTLFQICGIWKPLKCNSQWKLKLYQLYYIFTLTLFTAFTCSFFVSMFQIHEDVESYSQSVFYFFTFFNVLVKLLIVVIKRKIFLQTNQMLLSEMCRSCDIHETNILKKCSQIGRSNTFRFLILLHFTALTILLSPLMSKQNMTLPLPYWLPYSLESKTLFILSYFHQIFCIMVTVYISAGMETLALSLMLQICGQLEIIMHRLSLLPYLSKSDNFKSLNYHQEAEVTKLCIKRHLYIYSVAENINKQFGFVIFTQFFASMIYLCVIIFSLSRLSLTDPTSWIMISSIGSYTLQIFIYCYYGDKMAYKSSEIGSAIYTLNWNKLTISTQKSLITIMVRTTRPIRLTASSVIIMSIETFMKIIRSAYSAYNLLKNS